MRQVELFSGWTKDVVDSYNISIANSLHSLVVDEEYNDYVLSVGETWALINENIDNNNTLIGDMCAIFECIADMTN